MKLLLKERLFALFDSYDIYDENNNVVFVVKGKLAFGHKFVIYDAHGNELAMVNEKILTLLKKFDFYKNGSLVGTFSRELSLLRPKYHIDYNGWKIEGNLFGLDYEITDGTGQLVGLAAKELFRLRDTYYLEIIDDRNALDVLMIALSIDAEKCSQEQANNND